MRLVKIFIRQLGWIDFTLEEVGGDRRCDVLQLVSIKIYFKMIFLSCTIVFYLECLLHLAHLTAKLCISRLQLSCLAQ